MALSGALRWGSRHRRVRAVLVPLGLNLAALAFLGAVLVSGTEPGGMGEQSKAWVWFSVPTALVALAAFRFPRSVGLPILVLSAVLGWLVAGALKEFVPLGAETPLPTVQPLNDRETVTAFAMQADLLALPPNLIRELPTLFRLRTTAAAPAEWWWPWAASRGWARTLQAQAPTNVVKFGVYRLDLDGESLVWRLEKPELTVPDR